MNQQNYQNHRKMDPLYHGGIALLALATLVLSITFFVQNVGSNLVLSIFVMVMALLVLLIGVRLRTYALSVQDRVIRQEEQFRYYRMTGNMLDEKLTTRQIIALRFASDGEYQALVERAVSENLAPDEIKKAIQNWRADHHRV
ncbi:hypothetical protein FIU87_02655 [Bacillus sp. THAF10]|uniref:DUF6526 family protein n=1 Tax=Bacillus sp. THAF10 TaxID=2587848 RepID=UPI001267982A|nr:DUF6526 family protein [Bacillus sp. THAF10]QFT87541.1 hypothetical protein FIU87_02655 [Bacillus sp. THAF10]